MCSGEWSILMRNVRMHSGFPYVVRVVTSRQLWFADRETRNLHRMQERNVLENSHFEDWDIKQAVNQGSTDSGSRIFTVTLVLAVFNLQVLLLKRLNRCFIVFGRKRSAEIENFIPTHVEKATFRLRLPIPLLHIRYDRHFLEHLHSHRKHLLALSCPPIRLHVSVWFPPDRFLWNLILGTSMKICQ